MPRMWPNLCKALDRPDAADDPRFKTREARMAHRKECNDMIAERMATYTTEAMLARLAKYDLPSGPVYSIDQTFADPQVQHLKLAQKVTSPVDGDFEILRQPFTLSRTPTKNWTALAEYGANTEEVLTEFGFSEDEISALRTAEVVAGRDS